jgi:hypothetical protein
VTIQPIDLKKWREVAAKATPGPWHQHALMVSASDKYISRGDDICHCGLGMRPNSEINQSESNAEFIATFNPQTILALLDAHEAIARDAELWRYIVRENNKGLHGRFHIVWFDQHDDICTMDGVSVDGKDENAIVRYIDAIRHATQGD